MQLVWLLQLLQPWQLLMKSPKQQGISADGHSLAISDSSQPDHQSSVYLVSVGGDTPRRITQNSPSYWHGWSSDGKTLAFTGQRNGEFDIYTIPVTGGDETRLTTAKGLDDGPEYSPDGKYIYFNSERTGHMQIWRMRPDGIAQEQLTFDEYNNWFPHISPDGQKMVFLSCDRASTEQGCTTAHYEFEQWQNYSSRQTLRRARYYQRTVMVAR
jgi:TolB protein